MIELGKTKYRAVLVPASGTPVDLPCDYPQREDNRRELAQRTTLTVPNVQVGGVWLSSLCAVGAKLMLYADWGAGMDEVFRGTLWNPRYESASRTLTLIAHDDLIYLQRSEDNRYYKAGMTGKAIITDILKDWNVPMGDILGPSVAVGKQVFRRDTVAEMIATVLDDGKKRGGGTYIMRAEKGKVHVLPRGSNKDVYMLEQGKNVENTGYEISADDLVTRVKVIGVADDEGRSKVEATLDGRTDFGILQRIVQRSQEETLGAAKTAAQEILKENGKPTTVQKCTAPDLPFLRKGDRIFIKAGTLNGYYYIASIQRDGHRMNMEVEP